MLSENEINDLFKAKNISKADVGRALDVSASFVSQWVSGARNVPAKLAPGFADLIGTEPELISEQYVEYKAALSRAGKLPVFETKTDLDPRDPGEMDADVLEIELGASSCGTEPPQFIETRYKHTFSADWLSRQGIKPSEKLYRARVRGDSMEPVLFNGDMVLIRPADKRIVDDATYAIVVVDQLKVKKLRRRRDGGVDVVSCNEKFAIEVVPPDELDTLHIIGRVIDKSGSGGLG